MRRPNYGGGTGTLPAALTAIAVFTAAVIALAVLIGLMQCGKC